ncbi:hypothetical protein VOLCADRAFT_88477 [Volvox carteri f. nagariensis]|uniref:Uncharacterized protein n=1 Tax=Volvox carteri f. nagariensis TaxID=3068 RepID=D8TP38_VOLCA|nr:uncharacterized protein VOLCADRAFT_88477 [Volvox carteri f. nagariensis]EFJ50693.1 hypothetical protein VOLCADRAFT_88477 [Volvox carteri f. nagariensis]|eukprot:XP_002948286.1 hypothetical protein VOLCADRAFT_88477 [Volvox carteri f. nagariensis]
MVSANALTLALLTLAVGLLYPALPVANAQDTLFNIPQPGVLYPWPADNQTRDNVVYPKGWMHYQVNKQCTQAQTMLAFNAKSIGTVAIPLALGSSDPGYLQAAYGVRSFPTPGGVWVRDAECARACRLRI